MGTNDFSQETKELFYDSSCCWECGISTGRDPHHIFGRGSKPSKLESSPYNFAPLCRRCHDNVNADKQEKQLKYFWKTYHYLDKIDYEFNKNDIAFIKKYLK